MRTALTVLAALLALVVAVALIGPGLVDWNDYKPLVTAEVRRATGRDLHIDGDLSVAVLPAPTLTAAGVRLGNIDGGSEPDMASLRAVRVRIALLPLVGGRVEVESVILVEPTILLERLADGRGNWDLPAPEDGTGAGAAASGTAAADLIGAAPLEVRLNDLRVQDGVVIYRDAAAGTEDRVAAINARIAAGSLAGPFRMTGTARARGLPFDIDLGIGRLAEDRAIPVGLGLGIAGAGEARFDGIFAGWPAAPRLSGTLDVSGDDVGGLLVAAGAGGGAPRAHPFSAQATLTGSSAAVALDELRVALGDAEATGSARLDLGGEPRVDVALDVGWVDLDTLLAPAAGAASAGLRPAQGDAPAGAGFALPSGMSAGVEVKVAALTWRGKAMRQARLAADLANGEITVSQAAVLLPGGSDATAFGSVLAADGVPRFEGQVEINSDNLRGLLEWLEVDIAAVPAGRLRRLAATSEVVAEPGNVTLSGIDIVLDSSRIRGGVAVALRERLGLGVGLSLDRIDVDSYLPAPAEEPAPADDAAPAGGADAPAAAAAAPLPLVAALAGFDANARVRVDSATWRGQQLTGVALDATLQQGELTLRELAAEVGDNAVGLAGTLTGMPEAPHADLALTVAAGDPPALLALADVDAAIPGPVGVDARIRGGPGLLEIDATLEAFDGRLAVAGSVSPVAAVPDLQMAVELQHPDLAGLTAVLSGTERPAGGGPGPVALAARLTYSDEVLTLADIDGRIGPVETRGTVTLDRRSAPPRLEAALEAGEIVVDRLLSSTDGDGDGDGADADAPGAGASRWSREAIGFAPPVFAAGRIALSAPAVAYAGHRVLEPRLELELAPGALELHGLSGKAYGGDFVMTGRLAAPGDGDGVPEAALRIVIDDADAAALTAAQPAAESGGGLLGGVSQLLFPVSGVRIAAGRLGAEIDMTTRGASEFALVSGLAGHSRVRLSGAVLEGVDVCGISAALADLDGPEVFLELLDSGTGGRTAIADFEGRFEVAGGIATLPEQSLEADCATVALAGTVDLPQWTIDTRASAQLTGHPDFPALLVTQTGALDEPDIRVVNLNEVQQQLLGRVAESVIDRLVPDLGLSGDDDGDAASDAEPGADGAQEESGGAGELFEGILQNLLNR